MARGLTKAQVMELSTSRWVVQAQNVLVTSPTGVGKSFLACALGQKACRDGYGVVYRRTSRLFAELAQARADGTYPHLLRKLAKAQVLILDDFGLAWSPWAPVSTRSCWRCSRIDTVSARPW